MLSFTRVGGIEPDDGVYRVHADSVARATEIPVTSLRTIADDAFTRIVVPGYVVGWGGNWFHLAPAEPRK